MQPSVANTLGQMPVERYDCDFQLAVLGPKAIPNTYKLCDLTPAT